LAQTQLETAVGALFAFGKCRRRLKGRHDGAKPETAARPLRSFSNNEMLMISPEIAPHWLQTGAKYP
jgi:hypothetical protein